MVRNDDASRPPAGRRQFATTRWSIVLAAGHVSSPEAEAALATLCETYWSPLYAYVRRQGHDAATAQDLTQGFFARLLEKQDLRRVRRDRGRFRSFLLASLKHFLINEWDRRRTLKRGGRRRQLSLDFESAEQRLQVEPADSHTPEALFEKQWALVLLDQVRSALRREYGESGRAPLFERLQVYLTGERAGTAYGDAARELGMTEAAVKVAVHRLRRRFRERLRAEIAQTVASDEDVDDEIRALFEALRR